MTLHSRPQPALRAEESGFTLLEVLIAFAAASVFLVLVLSILPAQSAQTRQRLDKLMATELAYSLLEEYRLIGAPSRPEGKFEDWYWTYRVRPHILANETTLSSLVSLFEVTVEVAHSKRLDQKTTLSTIIARRIP